MRKDGGAWWGGVQGGRGPVGMMCEQNEFVLTLLFGANVKK